MRTEKAIRDFANYIQPIAGHWPNITRITLKTREMATSREYFRSLRAAEMEAWEMTGGDYVRSAVFAEAA